MSKPPQAVLFISFGGPERPEDIAPFLERVTQGRGIPPDRLKEVAHHYELIGGASPINEITRRQAGALREILKQSPSPLPVYIGQRNWHPFLEDTLRQMGRDGIDRAIGFITAAHRSEASLERYIEATEEARKRVGSTAPSIDYVGPWFDHSLFIEAIAARVEEALLTVPADRRASAAWIFTAHSIPCVMAKKSTYVEELEETARLVGQRLGQTQWKLAYTSRSGKPQDPWLEPDVREAIRGMKSQGIQDVLCIPIGFMADHVEILFDLDIEAKQAAQEVGIGFHRAQTVGDHSAFVRMMAQVIRARAAEHLGAVYTDSTISRFQSGRIIRCVGQYSSTCFCFGNMGGAPCRRIAEALPTAASVAKTPTLAESEPIRAVVVGGGIAGLSAALRLQDRLSILGRPYQVTLLEASDRFGGPIQTLRRDDFLLEAGPDAFLGSKPRGVGLAQDLGISRDLQEMRKEYRRSFIVWDKKLYPVPNGFYMLAPTQLESVMVTRLLSLKGKLRLLREPFVPLQPKADETLGSFVRRRLGPEMLERLAQPLVAGIYAADPDQLSLRATFPQFLEMEKRGGLLRNMGRVFGNVPQTSGARYSLFVTYKDGMSRLIERIKEVLGPSILKPNSSVQSMQCLAEEERRWWRLTLTGGQTVDADLVCLATPAYVSARLLSALDPYIAKRLSEIPYNDSATAHWGFQESQLKPPPKSKQKALDGVGFVIPQSQKRVLGAATFVHHKFAGRVPQGKALIRGFAGGASLTNFWARPDDQILNLMLTDLKQVIPIAGQPLFGELHRWKQAMPVYRLGHAQRIDEIDERLAQWPGLGLAGSWREGIGVPDCIDSGERAAEFLINYLCVSRGLGTPT